MSSAGLRTILYAQKKINSMTADISENENIIKSSDKKDNNVGEKTPKLNVINVNDEVYEVFEMTGFTDFVNVKKQFNTIFTPINFRFIYTKFE